MLLIFIEQFASKSPGFGNTVTSPSLFPVSATPVSSPNPLATLSPQATPGQQASPLTTSSPMAALNAQVYYFEQSHTLFFGVRCPSPTLATYYSFYNASEN